MVYGQLRAPATLPNYVSMHLMPSCDRDLASSKHSGNEASFTVQCVGVTGISKLYYFNVVYLASHDSDTLCVRAQEILLLKWTK
jgi:hypothetical protein